MKHKHFFFFLALLISSFIQQHSPPPPPPYLSCLLVRLSHSAMNHVINFFLKIVYHHKFTFGDKFLFIVLVIDSFFPILGLSSVSEKWNCMCIKVVVITYRCVVFSIKIVCCSVICRYMSCTCGVWTVIQWVLASH